MSTIKISKADKYYNKGKGNEIHVMNGIDLELPQSGMIAIFGKSGCGKTTLLNAIGGLDRTDSGSIEIFGNNIKKNTDVIRNKYIGYIFQNYNLNLNQTVYENVADALLLCGMEDDDEIYGRVVSALENVGMDKYKKRMPDTLSGGQQQRVAIARAIVKGPSIILADEPTGNLDETNTVMVMDILKEISKTRLVLLVTHEENLVDFYCDKVIELIDGRIASVRENKDTRGYAVKGKNDIYLGELPCTKNDTNGVEVEYYGEPFENVKIVLVNVNGKIYLKSLTPELKIIDDSSEIKLLDGVFSENASERKQYDNEIDMSALTPFEGKKFGRLFRFGSSVKLALRDNFSSKKKKGRRFLRGCMFMLSCVLVILTAINSVNIKSYFDLKDDHSDNIFYVPIESGKDYSSISDSIGENGIAYARIQNRYSLDGTYISFRAGNFMTASQSELYASANIMCQSIAEGMPLICGTSDIKSFGDAVITSALADDLIKSSNVSYIKDYADLVGLVSIGMYGPFSDINIKICGVVKSDEKIICLNDMLIPSFDTSVFTYDIAPLSMQNIYSGSIERGEVVTMFGMGYSKGDIINIAGKKYTVKDVIEDEYKDEYYSGGGKYIYFSYVMNDEDYKTLAYTADSESGIISTIFGADSERQYSHYMTVYASDPDEAGKYLAEHFGNMLQTPQEIFNYRLVTYKENIIASLISVAVILAIMCMCMFFMMRSSFMSRVKEVGILRAVGVSKKNIIYRFGVETVILSLLTVLLGYFITSGFIFAISDSALFSSVFYFPIWLAAVVFALIFASSLFFGVLPAIMLLKKTPSEILSKYDI